MLPSMWVRRGAAVVVAALFINTIGTPAITRAQEPRGGGPKRDLSGNQVVNEVDASLVSEAWVDLQQDGRCTAPALASRDLNGNGCVDVADVQVVLAQWGDAAPGDATSGDAAAAEEPSVAAVGVYTVNSAGDEADASTSDGQCATASGSCTLRAAIQQSNNAAGRETINFDIRNADGSCPSLVTIQANASYLIDDVLREGVTIDGYTQCGSSPNTKPLVGASAGGDAKIKIEVRGNFTEYVDGIDIKTPNNLIRGLALYNWDRQIRLSSAGSNSRIEGSFLGTNAANTFKSGGIRTHHAEGIRIEHGPTNNIIGGNTPAARNIISGNGNDGVHLQGTTSGNRIIGNYIGMAQDGKTELRNQADGVDFEIGPQGNWLGGEGSGEGNVIGGNFSDGIEVSHSTETKNNRVVGNYFGLNAFGTAAAPNDNNGISFEDAVDANYAYNNVVSGNGANGIRFYVLATNTQVYNNKVGVGPDGTTPMPNGTHPTTDKGRNGLLGIGGSQHNIVRNNIFANNPDNGILLSNTSDSTKNYFGYTYYNTFSQNTIYNNGQQGIRLLCKTNPADGQNYCANQGLGAPRITSATATTVSGTTCAGCKVEVFIADKSSTADASGDNAGEGKTFVGSGTADASGKFAVTITGVSQGQIVTATATDQSGNTSPFSTNVAVGSGTTPSPTATAVPPTTTTVPPSPTPSATATSAPSTRISLPGRFEVEDYRAGGEGVGYHDTTAGNAGGVYRTEDVDIQTTSDSSGAYHVGYITAGEWLNYDVAVSSSGAYVFTIRTATQYTGKSLHIEIDGVNVSGTVTVPNTGSYRTWTNVVTAPITLSSGNHTLRIVSDTGSFNLNYVTVTASSGSAPTPTTAPPTATAAPPTPTATSAPSTTRTFIPEADARVQESAPSTAYGTTTLLRTDGGSDPDVDSYLRFSVSGVSGTVTRATLRLWSSTNTADGPALYTTSNAWSEGSLTWTTRPGRTSGVVADRGAIGTGVWAEYDVTGVVGGNGTYSFVLATSSTDGIDFSAREGTTPPQLVLSLAP